MRRLLLAAAMLGTVSAAHAADLPDLPILRGGFTDGLCSPASTGRATMSAARAATARRTMNFTGCDQSMTATLLADTAIESSGGVSSGRSAGKASRARQRLRRLRRLQRPVGRCRARPRTQLHARQVRRFTDRQHRAGASAPTAAVRRTSSRTSRRPPRRRSTSTTWRHSAARAGYAWGVFLPYMFGGFALGHADIIRTANMWRQDRIRTTQARFPFCTRALAPTDAQHSHFIYGYTAGLGVDISVLAGLFLRAEWEYHPLHARRSTPASTPFALGLGYKF